MRIWNRQKAAIIFDFDKTLSPYYMQRPLFEDYKINEREFWEIIANTSKKMEGDFLHELIYLNSLISFNQSITNHDLKIDKDYLTSIGSKIDLFPGVLDFFRHLGKIQDLEVYIISSGLKEVIEGTPLNRYCDHIFACSFNYDYNGICGVSNVVSTREKACIIDYISRGSNALGFDYYPEDDTDRRIPIDKMIYVGDGVTDIPAFNIVSKNGGVSIGVFNPNEPAGRSQLEMIKEDGKINRIFEADYRANSNLYKYFNLEIESILDSLVYSNLNELPFNKEAVKYHLSRVPGFVHSWTKVNGE